MREVNSWLRAESDRILLGRLPEARKTLEDFNWNNEPTSEDAAKLRDVAPFLVEEGIETFFRIIESDISDYMNARKVGFVAGVLWGHARLNEQQRDKLFKLVMDAPFADAPDKHTRQSAKGKLMEFLLASIHQPEKPELYQPFLDRIQPRSVIKRIFNKHPKYSIPTIAVRGCIPDTQIPPSVQAQLNKKFKKDKF